MPNFARHLGFLCNTWQGVYKSPQKGDPTPPGMLTKELPGAGKRKIIVIES